MSEPNDKMLHDWVRQTLDAHRPDYDPAGWEQLRPRLCRRRFRPWPILALIVFLVGSLLMWLGRNTVPNHPVGISPSLRLPKNNVSLPSQTEGFPGSIHQNTVSTSLPKKTEVPSRNTELYNDELRPPMSFREKYMESRSVLPPADWWKKTAVLPIRVAPVPEIRIQQQMLSGLFGTDSTTYRVLTRNSQTWPNAVVVCDFTTSMTPYSTQLYAWLKKNAQNSAIKGTVLFTDCDSLGRETRAGGPAGQLFATTERDPARALPTFLAAYRNTLHNANEAENDIEALLFAQNRFPNADHLILIADIDNPVKDMALLNQITKPVHVVLCGRDWDSTQAFHPDFYTIARRTKGSLHTLEDDIDPAQLHSRTWLQVGNHYYRYHRGKDRFVLTRFRHRPKRLAGLFWW
ncbi:hypothetical protein LX87_01263 [Larkinella arboricola]|uniref:Uncharacterized protein n=1 Tax=Larkinella arboricola TaxID=643671 RepID=A0A327X8Q7_LARAB|nr:hypothetical protein [Larkinella arboricola]RAK03141.1 hypothetical protein LX87_01263 [Larkinella arboricola]